MRFHRVLLLCLALTCTLSWAMAAEEHADQVADPGEVENPALTLEEPLCKPELSTPTQVVAFVQSALSVPWEWSSKAPNVVVVRNAGAGYLPNPLEAAYDDLILVVTRTKVHHFSYANAEGTEHREYVQKYGYTKYVDEAIGKTMTPALDEGRYRFKVDLHQGAYKALHVYSWDWERFGLPSQRRNGRYGKYEVGAVNVHKGGSVWNWSIGCLTIHYSRYPAFIEHFTSGSYGRMYVIGDWNGLYSKKSSRRAHALKSPRQRRRRTLFLERNPGSKL